MQQNMLVYFESIAWKRTYNGLCSFFAMTVSYIHKMFTKLATGRPWGQFHQYFGCQSREAFAQIIFNAFYGNIIWKKYAKI
jgi:hypothetical protein